MPFSLCQHCAGAHGAVYDIDIAKQTMHEINSTKYRDNIAAVIYYIMRS